MDKNTLTCVRQSWLAAIFGGIIGYLLGAWADSQWLSFALFFVVGYIGYDFRRTIIAAKACLDFVIDEVVLPAWKNYTIVNPHPLLTLVMFLAVAGCVFGANNAAASREDFFSYLLGWPKYAYANLEWVFTGTYSSLPTAGMGVNEPLGRIVLGIMVAGISLVVGLLVAITCGWLIKGVLIGGGIVLSGRLEFITAFIKNPRLYLSNLYNAFRVVFGEFFSRLGLKKSVLMAVRVILLGIFYSTVGLLIIFTKTVVLFFKLIHSARRLATGLATLFGGMIYMIFVPFNLPVIPVPIAALLCGFATCAATILVQILLDGERVGSWMDGYLKRPIHSYIPVFKS